MSRHFLAILGALLAATPALAADELTGDWKRGDGKARVRIAPCGASLCATNTWIGDPSSGEKVGDRLVMTVKKSGEGTYTGSAHDPQRDLNLSMTIKVAQNSFTSSGCVLGGVLCRTMTWSR